MSKAKSKAAAKGKAKRSGVKSEMQGKASAAALVSSVPVTTGTFKLNSPKLDTGSPVVVRASQLRHVCRTSTSSAACFLPTRGKLTRKAKWSELKVERGASLEEKVKACRRVKGTVKLGKTKPIRPGKVELDFLSQEQARKLGLKDAGAYLRLCRVDDERGYLVPAYTPAGVKLHAKKFRECVGENKKRMPFCAAKTAQAAWPRRKNLPLGFF